jgi:hypothetical protein
MMPFHTGVGRVVLAVDRAKRATTVMHSCHGVWSARLNHPLPNAQSLISSTRETRQKGAHQNWPLSCLELIPSFATESIELFAGSRARHRWSTFTVSHDVIYGGS